MTELERDHFDAVRIQLLDATRRNADRDRRRRRRAMLVTTVAASVVLVTSIAAAASDRVATFVSDITPGTVMDVFEGDPEITDPPTPQSDEMLHDMEDLMRGGDPEARNPVRDYDIEPRVLLREEVDGIDVEIVAYQRPAGSPSSIKGARKPATTCWSVRTEPNSGGGGVTCSPAFMPALSINYGASYEVGCDRNFVTLAGIAANNVRAVRFETANGIEEATMGDRAFWWRSNAAPLEVHVEMNDGSTASRPYRFGEPMGVQDHPACRQ